MRVTLKVMITLCFLSLSHTALAQSPTAEDGDKSTVLASVRVPVCGPVDIVDGGDGIVLVACSASREVAYIDFETETVIHRIPLNFIPITLYFDRGNLFAFGQSVYNGPGIAARIDPVRGQVAAQSGLLWPQFFPTRAVSMGQYIVVNDLSRPDLLVFDAGELSFTGVLVSGAGPIVDFDIAGETVFTLMLSDSAAVAYPIELLRGERPIASPFWASQVELHGLPTSIDVSGQTAAITTAQMGVILHELNRQENVQVESSYERGLWGEVVRVPDRTVREYLAFGNEVGRFALGGELASEIFFDFSFSSVHISDDGAIRGWIASSAEVYKQERSGSQRRVPVPGNTTQVLFLGGDEFAIAVGSPEVVELHSILD